jgi:type I restriction enzyme S subunit
MTDLPQGWLGALLLEVASKIGSGATPKGGHAAYVPSGAPLIRSQNVHFSGFSDVGLAYLDEAQAQKLDGAAVCENDVLLNITGASIGRVTVAPERMEGARVNQHVAIIRPMAGIEPFFLAKYLASPPMQQFILAQNYGVTRQALTKAMIEDIELPVPPLPEQRRIVAKIDSLTGKSRRARDHLDHIPRFVEKYRQAILAAAFRGDLTRQWRSDRSFPSWRAVAVGGILRDIVAGKNLRCEERPPRQHERGVVKVSAVSWGIFDPEAAKTLPSDFVPPEVSRIRSGDLLISRANTLELVGAVVIVAQIPPNLFLSDKVLRLEMDDADKQWLMWFLRSPAGRHAIEKSATGNQLSMC